MDHYKDATKLFLIKYLDIFTSHRTIASKYFSNNGSITFGSERFGVQSLPISKFMERFPGLSILNKEVLPGSGIEMSANGDWVETNAIVKGVCKIEEYKMELINFVMYFSLRIKKSKSRIVNVGENVAEPEENEVVFIDSKIVKITGFI